MGEAPPDTRATRPAAIRSQCLSEFGELAGLTADGWADNHYVTYVRCDSRHLLGYGRILTASGNLPA